MRTAEDAVLPRALPGVLELAGLVQNALLPLLDRLRAVQNLRKIKRSERLQSAAGVKSRALWDNSTARLLYREAYRTEKGPLRTRGILQGS